MPHVEFTTVVVPVDFSDQSFAAVDAALELAGSPRKVCVVHVLPQISDLQVGMVWIAEYDQERCTRALNELRNRLRDPKYRGIDLQVAIGDAAHMIAKTAEVTRATLILMPSHGRTGFRHLLLGSVAERVVRLAECPVLVMKPPHDTEGQAKAAVVGSQAVGAH